MYLCLLFINERKGHLDPTFAKFSASSKSFQEIQVEQIKEILQSLQLNQIRDLNSKQVEGILHSPRSV